MVSKNKNKRVLDKMETKKGKQWFFFIKKKARRQANRIDKVNIIF